MLLLFEGEGLLPFEVMSTIEMTNVELQDIIDSPGIEDELLDSHLICFQFIDRSSNNVEKSLLAASVKNNHMLQDPKNCKYTTIKFENFLDLNNDTIERASNAKK